MDNTKNRCLQLFNRNFFFGFISPLFTQTLMNVVTKTVIAFADFLVINVVALPFVIGDPALLLWYGLCVALGFILRLGMENRAGALTWKTACWHSICTVAWSFLAVLVWRELGYKRWFEVYLFLNSLFAAFMVAQLETIGKQSIKDWIRIKVGKFLATEKVEDNV